MRDRDTGRLGSSRSRLADERGVGLPNGFSALSSLAVPAVVDAIQDGIGGSPVRQSTDLCIRVSVAQRKKPLAFCNRYIGGGGDAESMASGPLVSDLASATDLLDVYDASALTIKGVEVGVRVRRGLALAELALGIRSARRLARRRPHAAREAAPAGRGTESRARSGSPFRATMPAGPRDVLLRGNDADVDADGLRLVDARPVGTVRRHVRRGGAARPRPSVSKLAAGGLGAASL